MSKMKILLWAPWGAGLHYSGGGMNAYRLYNSAVGKGHDFEVSLVCNIPEQEDYPIFDEVHRLGNYFGFDWARQGAFLRDAKQWLKDNHHRFDVFHGIDVYEGTVRPAYWAQQLGLPAFVKPAMHGSGLASSRKRSRKFLRLPEKRRELVKQLSGVVAISQEIEDEMFSYNIPENIVFRIPNGVDVDQFKPDLAVRAAVRKQYGWKENTKVILFVGAIGERKRPAWILEAAQAMLRERDDVVLVYVGPERQKGYLNVLKGLCVEMGCEERTRFIGHCSSVAEFYQAADIYCLPSTAEGMPNSVLEAMASGLPILGTRISGSDELIIDGENGYFIESPEQLSQRLAHYIDNSEVMKAHGRASLRRIEADYSCEKVLGKYLCMFSSATK